MTLESRLAAGNRAKHILEDEVFTGAFDATEAEVIEQWKNSPARDQAGRESLWQYLQILRKVKANLIQTMDTGKLAALDLQHQQTVQDRLRSAWDGLRSA